MHITKVGVDGIRNLAPTSFTPSPGINLITGSNGSGKSSLLEAIVFLATGASFRTHRTPYLINNEAQCMTLFSEVRALSTHKVGVRRCRDTNQPQLTRIDGADINKRSELVQLLPLQVISPESVSLLLEGSDLRRNFIDWSLFHVEHVYHYHLSNYNRALKQRNMLLRQENDRQISSWDALLDEHGQCVNNSRHCYIDQLIPVIQSLTARLLPGLDVTYQYRSGWLKNVTLLQSLADSLETDLRVKHTTVGPHRGDLIVKIGASKATEVLSRGQLKLLVICLKLAQSTLLQRVSNKTPVVVIDDLAAELDIDHRQLMLQLLKELGCQVFVTTPQKELIDIDGWQEKKVFHVEHGHIKEMV